jgi:hypothetical protein
VVVALEDLCHPVLLLPCIPLEQGALEVVDEAVVVVVQVFDVTEN